MLSTQPYKGARDFYPEEKRIQKYIFAKMRAVVERFGYEEYDAPILEPLELYLAKSGEEIVNEQTYVFEDRGGRTITIRPEMTPTVSRMVAAKRQDLALPLRWYSIPNLWRYERPQRGRLREHWQLNVDVFGLPGLEAEHEIIQVADSIMHNFGAKRNMYVTKVNSRKFIDYLLTDYMQLNTVQTSTLMKLIDRMNKTESAVFSAAVDAIFSPSARENGLPDQLLKLLKTTSIGDLPLPLRSHESISEIEQLIQLLKNDGISNVEFDSSLMRGFDYYTDIVFEVFDRDPTNNRSMFGGGRYDGLLKLFGVEPIPTVGLGMGDVTLQNFLETHGLLPKIRSETDAYVILIGDIYTKAHDALNDLRNMGLKIAVDMTDRKIATKIKAAVKKDIRYVIFIGEQELATQQYVMRDLETGEEEKHSPARMVSLIKDRRNK